LVLILCKFKGAPTPEELGFADEVSVEEIGSTKVTIFRQEAEEKSGISTILVRASTQNTLDDIERAIGTLYNYN
jgi:T-complex protein 1 subunit theta